MSLVKKCVLKFFVWERAFNVRRRRSEPWLWHTATYEGFSGAEKFQVNAFMHSRCAFSVVLSAEQGGVPFWESFINLVSSIKKWLQLSCPSSRIGLLRQNPFSIYYFRHHSSKSHAEHCRMRNRACGGNLFWPHIWGVGLKVKWSQRRNSHYFSTSSVQGQGEGYWFDSGKNLEEGRWLPLHVYKCT